MSKKKYGVILVLFFAVLVCACGDKKVTKEEQAEALVAEKLTEMFENINDEDIKAEEKSEAEETELGYVYNVPCEELYINVPDAFHYREYGYCQMFMSMPHSEKYVCFVYDKEQTPTDLEEAFNSCYDVFYAQVNIHGEDTINGKSVTHSTEVINGMEVEVYEGTLACGIESERTEYFCGYVFSKYGESRCHEIPYAVFGVVKDMSNADDMETIKRYTRKMIESVRETR